DSPLPPFTAGNVAGRLYSRPSGQRVLIVDKKVIPPDFVDEVLELRSDKPNRWLKPIPISDITQIPSGELFPADSAIESWKEQFFYIEEHTVAQTTVPGLRPPQIGALYASLAHWKVTQDPANVVMPTGTG